MSWLAISKSGKEYIFKRKPKRCKDSWDDAIYGWIPANIIQYDTHGHIVNDPNYGIYGIKKASTKVLLPKNSIIALAGKKLTWKDEPIKI